MKPGSELALMVDFLGAASRELPDIRLMRRQVLNIELEPGLRVRASIPGQADIYGIIRGGRLIEIELKTYRGRLSEAQVRWRSFCQAWGVPYLLLTSLRGEPAHETVARWVAELKDKLATLA